MLQMLDDFVDVTKDEKQMMHMWNSFVRKQRYLSCFVLFIIIATENVSSLAVTRQKPFCGILNPSEKRQNSPCGLLSILCWFSEFTQQGWDLLG